MMDLGVLDLASSDGSEDAPPPMEEPSAETYQMEPPTTGQDSHDLSDIGRFGNSDASAVGEGSLRYNIYVSGIDTADVRSQFREAVTDKKMMWDTDLILRSIQNGEVKVAGMSAVKAYILVSRLRNLPVQVRWEQYAISQA
jgi:hypothetical protein